MAPFSYTFPEHLPDASRSNMDFFETSFFRTHDSNRQLPSPGEVIKLSGRGSLVPRPNPVIFQDLNLIVKFGTTVRIAEAQCLWAIRHVLGNAVPVPEVYGWRVNGEVVFIYMEYVCGDRLQDRWEYLRVAEKTTLCDELRSMITALRQVEHPSDPFIGSIDGQGPLDYVFEGMPGGRPFPSVKNFSDWISWLPQRNLPDTEKISDPYRSYLPDDDHIVFTHSDIHRSNIIISTTSPPHIAAVVDWGQSGWCLAYWEYYKTLYTTSYLDEWRIEWIPKFLTPRNSEFEVLSEYFMSIGAI